MQQYNFSSSYQEPSFLDPFLFENESKKESTTTKSYFDISHGDASSFLSPSMLSSFDVGLEQMFQPLIDESSIPTANELMTPSHFVEQDHFFNQEVLQYMEVPQERQIQHEQLVEEDQALEEEHETKKEISPERKWFTSYTNEPLVGSGDVEISLKTRREKPTSLVPERLYSSLKYEIQITATGEFVRSVPFLLARISVVDAKTFEPISKNNKAVTKGENESALTHPPNGPGNIIKGTIKVQFDSSISYHHDKREVRLEMNFFLNEALDKPILTKRTVPVKMFARKPNKKHNKTEVTPTKRKREAEVKEEAQPAKIAKVAQPEFQFSDFEKRLDSLVESSINLSYEDRQRATGLILQKFGLLQFVLGQQPDPYNHQYHQ